MRCKQCHSQNTATFRMIQLQGNASGSFSGIGVDFDGNLMIDSGSFHSRNQLAQFITLPSSPNFWNAKMIFGILLSFVLMIVNFLGLYWLFWKLGFSVKSDLTEQIIFVSSLILFFGLNLLFAWKRNPSYKKEAADYQELIRNWHRSVMCLRCGYSWLLNEE